MSCEINNGRPLGCFGMGGIEGGVYLSTFTKDLSYTTNSNGIMTGVTSANTAYYFEADIEWDGFNQDITNDRNAGSSYFESNLTVKMIDLDADHINTIRALSKAPLTAYFRSNNGTTYAIGLETAGRVDAGTSNVGTAAADMNGSEITINFKSKNGAVVMEDALLGTSIVIG
jgi:hypothetical protein